jgi:ABC-type iron transport system FetAB ATPase subunit
LGQDLDTIDPLELRRNVAMVFQQPVALPGTVADNLREVDPTLDAAALADALTAVGLSDQIADRPAGELSVGEMQRVALARSLMTDPQVVLLDEATSALDGPNVSRVEELVAGLRERGVVSIWVTHDLEQVMRIAEQVLVVIDGTVVQQGPVGEVLAQPAPEAAAFVRGDLS